MTNIVKTASDLIGNTPLLELSKLKEKYNLEANLYGKLELFNLSGSVKDRIALAMIEAAESDGSLKPGGVIIEPTSGNTGIGLSAVGVNKGYRVIIVMPETFSVERRALIKAYGAEIVLSDGGAGMKGAIAKAEEIAAETPNSFIPSQFSNPANWKIHYSTTGKEIDEALSGKADILISGAGTGGTATGVGKYMKEKNPNFKVVVVEAAASPVISGGEPGKHVIQGISPGFVPDVLVRSVIDEVVKAENEDALNFAREFTAVEGVLVGISSGAAVWAGIEVAKRPENKGKNIVVVIPDSGDRYLSTALFQD